MSKVLRPLSTFLQKLFQSFRTFSIVLALIAVTGFGGSLYFWNTKNVVKDHSPQTLLSSTPPADTTESADEEEDNDDEEDAHDTNSPWTLLKTALPSHYFEPIAKVQTPTIAVILTGLGLNKDWTTRILATFKERVTFVFSPYSPHIEEQLRDATNSGYQALIALPMEPYDYPNLDPGPLTLLTGVKAEENLIKTKEILKKIPKGMGVIGHYGSRFTLSQTDLEPVLKEIKDHGSVFVDPSPTLHSEVQQTCKILGMTCHQVDLKMPLVANASQIEAFFKKVIQSTKENGIIIIEIPAIPAFTDHLLEWMDTFEKQGVNFVTVANLKIPGLSTDMPAKHQGTTNASKQDPH